MTVKHDITVPQGANFEMTIEAKNADRSVMNLTGWSARMQVRETVESVTPLLDASTSNGRITINAPGGIVMVNVDASVTGAMVWTNGVYDLEIFTSATNVKRLAEGFAYLSPEVTR